MLARLKKISSFLFGGFRQKNSHEKTDQVIASNPLTPQIALSKFLDELRKQQPSESTIRNYSSDISQFIEFSKSENLNQMLTEEKFKQFFINQQQKGLKPSSIQRKIVSLKQFASWIERNSVKQEIETVVEKTLEKNQKKNSYQDWILGPYFHLATLAIFFIFICILAYRQFFVTTPSQFAFPTSPVTPERILSFQARLTDSAGNPITTATNTQFRLYTASSGGTQLWSSGTCSIDPDQDGIFSTILGSTCGSAIASSVFTENAEVWLEIQVVSETLTPRQRIATVPYALNSETLQGFPINSTESATTNTVLVMNEWGEVLLGEASPRLRSVSGTFTISGQAVSITTNSGSNGNITLDPDGTGITSIIGNLIQNGYLYTNGATISATYAGSTPLVINGTGGQIVTINNAGDITTAGDLAVNGGDITATGDITINPAGGNVIFADGDVLNIGGASAQAYNFFAGSTTGNSLADSDNDLYIEDELEVDGNAQFSGSVTVTGLNTAGGIVYTNSSGQLLTSAQGVAAQCLQSGGSGAPTWGSCGGAGSNWRITTGALSPINDTLDLLVGSSATSSAKFAVINVNSGTPTASLSAGAAGGAYLTATGTLQTTANQTLTIGGSTTGNISISPLNGSGRLTVNGDQTLTGDLAVNGGDITSTGDLTITPAGGNVLLANNVAFNVGGASAQAYNFFAGTTTGNGSADGDNDLYIEDELEVDGGATFDGPIAANNDVTIGGVLTANSTTNLNGTFNANGTVNLGDGGDAIAISGTTISLTANSAGNDISFNLVDNNADALDIQQGTDDYINVSTLNGTEAITFGNSSTNPGYTFAGTGNIGIGSTPQTGKKVYITQSSSANQNNSAIQIVNTQTSAVASTLRGIELTTTFSGTSGTQTGVNGLDFTVQATGNGGTVSAMKGISAWATVSAGATVSDLKLIHAVNPTNSGTLTTAYGVYIDNINSGSTNYSLYSAGGNIYLGSGTYTLASFNTNGGLLYTNGSGVVAQTAAGSLGECLISNGGGAPSWGSCSGGSLSGTWRIANGAHSPINDTLDLLVGSNASSSAKFAVLNVNSGTPTASLSAGAAGGAYLTATGTLQTTANQSLTLGGSTTGNITLSPKNGTGGTATLNGQLILSGATTDITTPATEDLIIESGTTGAITIGGDSSAENINLGTGAAAKNVSIGNGTGTTSIYLQSGTTGMTFDDSGGGGFQFQGQASSYFSFDSSNATPTTGSVIFDLDSSVTGGYEAISTRLAVNDGAAAGDNFVAQDIILTANDADADVFGQVITANATANAGAGSYEALLKLVNAENTASTVTDAILIDSTSGTDGDIVDAIDVSNANITNAINVGANVILGTTANIDFTNFDVVGSSGNITTAGDLAVNGDDITSDGDLTITAAGNNILFADGNTLNVGGASAAAFNFFAASTASNSIADGDNDLYIQDELEVDGAVRFDNSTITMSTFTNNGGLLYTNASGVLAQTAVGNSGECLTSVGGGTPVWSSCSASSGNLWRLSLGALSPVNDTADLLIGSNATTSAKFAVLNVNSGTPTASLSAGAAGGAYLSATGTLQTTANQSLTLGGSTTGNISLNPLNGTGTTTIAGILTQTGTGQVTFGGNVDATNGLDVTTANLTVGGSNFTVAPGTGNITTAGDLALNGDDLTSDGALTINATTYTRIGDTATPGSATGDDDLYVESDVEIDGNLYLDGGNITGPATLTLATTTTLNTSLTAFNCTDCINWDDISDSTTLDASTSIAFGASTFNLTFTNDGSGNEIHNLSSTGDIVLQDAGDTVFTFDDSGNVTFDEDHNRTTTYNSLLTGGTRSTDVVTISQANDGTFDNSANLLQLTNSDTGSTAALLDVSQAAAGTGIAISGASGAMTGISMTTTLQSGVGITINTPSLTTGTGFRLTGGTTGTLSSYSGDQLLISPTRTHSGASTITESGNYLDVQRALTNTNAGGTINITGDLATLSNTLTETAGTITDSSNVLSLAQNCGTGAACTGAVLDITNAGTGEGVLLTSSSTGNLITLNASGAVTTADGLTIAATDVSGIITDAIDVSDAEIVNGINVGSNFILGNGIQMFSSSSTVWTIEDTSGNDIATFTDGGTTGDLVVTNTISAYGTSIGLNNDASANNTLSFGAGAGQPTGDLYWGSRLLCTAASVNCGWSTGTPTWDTIGDSAANNTLNLGSFTTQFDFTGTTTTAWLLNANSVNTGIANQISTTALTSGSSLSILGGGANMTAGGELADLSMGAATAGNGLNISTTGIYTGTGLATLTANSATTGVGQAISMTGLTSGSGLSITGGTSMTTNGELLDLNMGAATAGNGINITTTGVYTGTGLAVLTANSATTGIGQAISMTGLTTGSAQRITGSGATMQTTGELVDLVLGANTVGAGLTITSTGTYTGTGSADGMINVVANSLTTGLGSQYSFTGLTSGSGIRITGGTSMTTNGELLDLNMGAATAGNGANITTTGVYTGTGLAVLTANSATTGVGQAISMTGLTTGSGLRITGGTSMTTNGELADLDMGAATAGNGLNVTTTGVYTGTGLAVLTANSATTGVGQAISMTGLTTGSGLRITGGTSMTTNGELLDLNMGAATAGNGSVITTTGVYTGTGLSTITANSATTGVGQAISMTGLTTGSGMTITGGASMAAGGELLDLNMGAATAGNGANITTTGVYTGTGLLTLTANSATTGTLFAGAANGLTTGKMLDLTSTSTVLTTGKLASYDWSPSGSTEIFATAGSSLFNINVGQYGNISKIFNIQDNGSDVFTVGQSIITSALPHEFTAAGDVSVAYDIVLSNQTASTIKSVGPMTIEAGESFENNDLTLTAYGTGALVVSAAGGSEFTRSAGTVISANRTTSDGTIISLQQDGTEEGTISVSTTTVSYNAFTGSHYALVEGDIAKGELVTLNGNNTTLGGRNQSEIIYGGARSTVANDSKILGAYLSILEPDELRSNSNPELVMAVGNGVAWVVENGENVEVGDYLISSDTAGHAMKDLGQYDRSYIVARVAEPVDWSTVSETTADGKKHKLVSVLYESFIKDNILEMALNSEGDLSSNFAIQSPTAETNNRFSVISTATSQVVTRLASFAQLIVGQIQAGLVKTQELVADRITVNQKLTAPEIVTDQIKTKLVSPTDGQELTFNLGNNANNELNITNNNNEEVASIDQSGNADFAGTITSENASISGEISARSGRLEQLAAQRATLSEAEITNATISGELFLPDGRSINSILADNQDYLASLSAQTDLITNQIQSAPEALTSTSFNNFLTQLTGSADASVSAAIANLQSQNIQIDAQDMVLAPDALFVKEYLNVSGYTQLNTVSAQSLTVANSLIFTADTIATSGETLFIQPVNTGRVNILAGLLVLNADGNAEVNGNLIVSGDVKIGQKLNTNAIQPNDFSSDFSLKLATQSAVLGETTQSRFSILDASNSAVASIDASGSARFKNLAANGLTIAQPVASASDSASIAQAERNATAGSKVLPAFSTELTIENNNIDDNDLIYLTPTSDTANQVLFIKSKETCSGPLALDSCQKSFTVGIKNAVTQDINFNFWIVRVE